MKQQEVFKKIGSLIQDLTEHYKYIGASGEPVNDVELELFIANVHYIADHADILRKLNTQSIANAKSSKPEPVAEKATENKTEKYFEPVVRHLSNSARDGASSKAEDANGDANKQKAVEVASQQTPASRDLKMNDLPVETGKDAFDNVEQEQGVIRHELSLDDLGDWDEDEANADDSIAEELPPVTYPAASKPQKEPEVILAQVPKKNGEQEAVITFNQKMSAQVATTSRLSDSLSAQPLTDLKSAISLNEKLLFIKELFNGYSLAYSEAVEILNRFNNFEEADQFLKGHYFTKNKWADKQSTVDKFYALLHRRFAS